MKKLKLTDSNGKDVFISIEDYFLDAKWIQMPKEGAHRIFNENKSYFEEPTELEDGKVILPLAKGVTITEI